ncbi:MULTISPECIES: hypothetical protein [Campylobacter]|uniref:Putative membrane protein n=1 Tax=Campylobacter porcelli TaxID=1660073 RepID=A0A1X9SXG5_9BACT|nr:MULTISPECIES: hypothetical protein [unclassified Campylobacter]MCR8696164.1 hypothetical protein [Campylobacter sp. RM19073]MEE3704966.1 hypothetical protein [Campylobacter sp. CX2-8023-23]MEE3744416.1 hypothetical protein [Campylobacter sp. CX2-4855-23]MEE3777191.1 hypothetical protein [Campylobacter sp. CX2-4080-23]ARR00931.1 putative membrane protein [Campylobacter sp. RM6137]
MQRNSINSQSLRFNLFCISIVVYEIFSITSVFLPSLIGVFFAYLVILKDELDRTLGVKDKRWYLSLAFLIFAEQLNGFEFCSVILAWLFFYYLINDWLKTNIKWRKLLITIYVFSGYIITLAMSNIVLYVLNQPRMKLDYEYLLYAIIESLIALVIFRGRIL